MWRYSLLAEVCTTLWLHGVMGCHRSPTCCIIEQRYSEATLGSQGHWTMVYSHTLWCVFECQWDRVWDHALYCITWTNPYLLYYWCAAPCHDCTEQCCKSLWLHAASTLGHNHTMQQPQCSTPLCNELRTTVSTPYLLYHWVNLVQPRHTVSLQVRIPHIYHTNTNLLDPLLLSSSACCFCSALCWM